MIPVTLASTTATLLIPLIVALATEGAWRTLTPLGASALTCGAALVGGAALGIIWGPQFRRHWTLPTAFVVIVALAYGIGGVVLRAWGIR